MANETVTLKLPSGEEIDAIVPAGLDDAGVKALVRMKHPDLFGPPAPAAGPHVKMHEANLVTGNPNPSFDNAPAGATGDLKQSIEGTVKGALQVTSPGIAASFLKERVPSAAAHLPKLVTDNVTPTKQLPGQIITTGLMAMEGGLGEPNVPPRGVPMASPGPRPTNPGVKAATDMVTDTALHAIHPALPLVKRILGKLTGGSNPEAAQAAKPVPSGWPAPSPELIQAQGLMQGGKPGVPASAGLGRIPVNTPPTYPGAPLPEHPGTFPGAPLPEAPARAVLQARSLQQGAKSISSPAEPLGQIPIAKQAATPQATPEELAAPRSVTDARPVHGESALVQVLTAMDNATLLKIARSRGINVAQEAALKPGIADNLLVKKIITDFTPEQLDEIGAQYLENTKFKHAFGDIGPEAWHTLSLKSYFPDLKIPETQLVRTQKAIESAAINKMPARSVPAVKKALSGDALTPLLEKSVAEAKKKRLVSQ